MKTTWFRLGFLAFMGISGFFSSCDIACIRGEGNLVTENRDPGSFNGIKLSIPGNVVITQGSVTQAKIQAQQNLQRYIKTNVRKGRLEITSDECFGENKGITVFVTVPEIQYLSIDGSGSISSDSTLNVSKLELVINGSGDIDLSATAELVYCGIKGSGNVDLKGSSKQQFIRINGSGNYNAFTFPSDYAEIEINGSGDAEIFALSKLRADIQGSGNIYYKGNPDVKSSIHGSGNIERK
jgi:lipopolysaccharide export system protein LptA